MEVALVPSSELPAGTVLFPAHFPEEGLAALRLGIGTVPVRALPGAPPAELHLAPDVWERLAVPWRGIRLRIRRSDPEQAELGPALAVVYSGRSGDLSPEKALMRSNLCYGHLQGEPGLFALGFDESIDWDAGAMNGYVLDQQPGQAGTVQAARFPIPAAVRLSFSIYHSVVERLRELTGNRTFNWVRGMDKSEFHTLASAETALRPHLPETRSVRGPADLAALLVRHETIFVKHVLGSRGRSVARVRSLGDGLEVSHMDGGQMVRAELADLEALWEYLRSAVGSGRWIAQQGIDVRGQYGRASHFRIVMVRDGRGRWHCVTTEALVALDGDLAFTNLANGAETAVLVDHLVEHHGLSPDEARHCEQEMVDLSLRLARVLERPYDPLGILGIDVGRELATGRLWLFEANAVPGWGYPAEIEEAMARSMTDYALFLSGWNDRLP